MSELNTSHLQLTYSTPGELLSAVESSLANIRATVLEIINQPKNTRTFSNTIAKLSLALAEEQDTLGIAIFLQQVSESAEIRTASRKAEGWRADFLNDIYSQLDLYECIKLIIPSDSDELRLQSIYIESFERNGIGNPITKDIHRQISVLCQQFDANLNEDTTCLYLTANQLIGLADDYLVRTRQPNGIHKITMKYPDIYPILETCSVRETRKLVRSTFEGVCPQNRDVLKRLFELRNQFAKTLGYESWTQYAPKYLMAETSPNVINLLQELIHDIQPYCNRYFEKLEEEMGHPLENYDVRYAIEKHQNSEYHIDNEMIRPYFPFPYVFDKMLKLYGELLSVHFEQHPVPKDCWTPTVMYIRMFDRRDSECMGELFCDMFPREGKYIHAACFAIRDGHQIASRYALRRRRNIKQILPVAVLVCNFPPPTQDTQSLLSRDEVETLFHEFGHALHALCSGYRSAYPEFCFRKVVTDFIETPSQVVEQWLWEPQILKMISSHVETHEPLSDDMIEKIVASRYCGNSAYEWLRVCGMALFDHTMYMCSSWDCVPAYFESMMVELFGLKLHNSTYLQRWTHLGSEDYAGCYYSYVWSIVIAADVYTVFKNSNSILDPELGQRYRTIILEPGNRIDANNLVQNFLGRRFNDQAFLNNNIGCQ